MHNNIMAAGSRDRPPMLAPGRYPQWRSRFLRYVDTIPNGEALKKCIMSGPYKPTTVLVQVVEATDDSPAVPEHMTVETPTNMSLENKAHFLAEKEAIHLILTVIRDNIYSTLDAYQTPQEMWEAIERLQQGQFRNSRTVNVVAVRENVGSKKAKRVKDSAYHKEKMLLCKQAKQGVPLQAEQYDWLADTDEEVDEQELEAHYSYMAKIQEQSESVSNTCLVETDDSNVILDSPDMCGDDIQNEQNDVDIDDERVALANLIANLKLDVDENKKIQKQLKKANTTLAQELKECKSILAKTSKSLGESISVRDSCLVALQTKQTEFEKYKAFNDRTIDYDKLERKLNEALGQLAHKDTVIREGLVKQKTKVITDLKLREEHDIEKNLSMEKQLKFLNEVVYKRSQSIQTIHMMAPKVSTYNGRLTFANPRYLKQAQSEIPCLYVFPYDQNTHANRLILDREETLALERESRSKLNKDSSDSLKFVHELKQEMHVDLKYVETLEKEIDELKSDKVEFSNMYDVILQECVSKDVMCSYLMSLSDLDVLDELQCMYLHKVKECDCLAQKLSKQSESVSKKVHTELLQRFDKVEKHSISLEIALQNCKEQNIAISELKKLIEKGKGKYVDTKFDRPSIVRQPNAQRIPKPSVLGKPTPFLDSLERKYFPKTKSVPKANVSEGLSKPITTQTLPQTASKAVSNTNVLRPRMYRIDNRIAHTRAPQLPQTVRNTNLHVSTSTGVNPKPIVSKPQFKSNQSKDKVLPNNSQVKVKKTQVEVYPRIHSVSNKMKFVTLNANAVCATCNKCLVDSNHFTCVTKMLNDMHARTKKPTVVPISTRKPKSQANKSMETPNKKKIVQLILFIVNSGCTKHMTGNLKLLCNFIETFLGTVRFGNDQVAPILGYGDLVQGNVTINRVYYIEGLNHNLFSAGSDLYTISLQESISSTPLYLMAKATPTQAWLWHRRLSHLNFDYTNLLSKKDIVIGLPKLNDEFPLPDYFLTASEDRFPLLSERDAPAEEVCTANEVKE
uniref:Uncharacterized protein n=1 Tax=Tanacetum cinerariifolium TaxID=118510 RepID=A0A6L2K663_TANCI|nr:hypothetical protein [Tanacetum cinerariifolium]